MSGLYQVENPSGRALQGMESGAQSAAAMQKKTPEPGKSAMGAISTGAAGASLGATIGTAVSSGAAAGPWGAVAGAAVGVLSYFLM